MLRNKKGFTLIEMLVVIAIIAVLVAIVIPVVGNTTMQAKAATDVANLRAVYAELNILVINGQLSEQSVQEVMNSGKTNPTSTMDPEAKICAVFDTPGFIEVFYYKGDVYYGFAYLSELATNGPDSPKLAEIGTAKPNVEGTWCYRD